MESVISDFSHQYRVKHEKGFSVTELPAACFLSKENVSETCFCRCHCAAGVGSVSQLVAELVAGMLSFCELGFPCREDTHCALAAAAADQASPPHPPHSPLVPGDVGTAVSPQPTTFGSPWGCGYCCGKQGEKSLAASLPSQCAGDGNLS